VAKTTSLNNFMVCTIRYFNYKKLVKIQLPVQGQRTLSRPVFNLKRSLNFILGGAIGRGVVV
jgi:hypothetical protein